MAMTIAVSVAVVMATAIVYLVMNFLRDAVWKPLRMRRLMAKQGVHGPPFRLIFGNFMDTMKFRQSFPDSLPMDDFANLSPTVTPQFALYFPKYGKSFLYWWGKISRLVVRDAEIVKELIITNHEFLTRSELQNQLASQVLGNGMLTLTGQKWMTERRTVTSFFHQDELKAMVESMVSGAAIEIKNWEQAVADGDGVAEFDVAPDLHKISGRIISRTAFGEDFVKGEQIFKFQTLLADELVKVFRSAAYWLVPGYRNFPTKGNRLMNQYISKVDALLLSVINGRREAVQTGELDSYGDDLLGRMLAAASEGWSETAPDFNLASVYNNCKLFYFAGQDTVANTTNFAFLMLALHPEWQDRARSEVLEVLDGEEEFTAGAMSRLKVVGMVLNETLRLFPPAPALTRVTTKDLHLKSLFIPRGMTIEFAMIAIHHDREYWGPDVGKFNPGRFANGVSEACSHRQAFFPFSLGPKSCIGNNFAVMEAKIVLAMVLRRFRLLPSPKYKHHPTFTIVQKPKFGLPIILQAL